MPKYVMSLILVVVILIGSSLHADNLKLIAKLSNKKVKVGEMFEYIVTVTNYSGDLKLTMNNLNNFKVYNQFSSNSYKFKNNNVYISQKNVVTLIAENSGKHVIANTIVNIDDKAYEVNSVNIQVDLPR